MTSPTRSSPPAVFDPIRFCIFTTIALIASGDFVVELGQELPLE